MKLIKLLEIFGVFLSLENPIFGQIYGPCGERIDGRNTEINRGQETHPIRVNMGYQIKKF